MIGDSYEYDKKSLVWIDNDEIVLANVFFHVFAGIDKTSLILLSCYRAMTPNAKWLLRKFVSELLFEIQTVENFTDVIQSVSQFITFFSYSNNQIKNICDNQIENKSKNRRAGIKAHRKELIERINLLKNDDCVYAWLDIFSKLSRDEWAFLINVKLVSLSPQKLNELGKKIEEFLNESKEMFMNEKWNGLFMTVFRLTGNSELFHGKFMFLFGEGLPIIEQLLIVPN